MTTPVANSVQSPRPPRWRFFVQYSLRTLLLVTTVVAVGCWWFLRPRVLDEQLAGKFLQLRRQVRFVIPEPRIQQSVLVNVGHWQLRDDAGNLLVAGQYDRDLPEGWWTIYHANGRKAVQGKVLHGAKVGLWRVWDEKGQLTSEAQYRAAPLPAEPPARRGQLSLLPNPQPVPAFNHTHQSIRHGPVRTWYASGQLKFEGAYKDDRRDGLWTFYDEQARVVEKRKYE